MIFALFFVLIALLADNALLAVKLRGQGFVDHFHARDRASYRTGIL